MGKILRAFLVAALLGGGGLLAHHILTQEPQHTPGVTAPVSSAASSKAVYALRVLFIGNSYTFYNNLPGMLLKIAESDPDNTIRFTVQSVTEGGIGLKELWERGNAYNAIQAGPWDYVVLQEQSFWAMFPESVITTTKMARLFDEQIRLAQSRTLLVTTWPRQPGSHWYTDGQTSFLRSPEYMLHQFDIKTQELSERLGGAVVIPVGDYWLAALGQHPDIPLYIADGTHPSPAGTYLAALVYYRYFTGRNAANIGYVPGGITAAQAKQLQALVQW
ncbi:MAG: hypothetical protein EBV03_05480 [Proteobacteria bacterium]|nr:hypothetical protein [Pseudomonadota bacterium]